MAKKEKTAAVAAPSPDPNDGTGENVALEALATALGQDEAEEIADAAHDAETAQLFALYLARVAKAETVNTMRRDARAIFRDAFLEAKVALEVFKTETSKED